MKKRLHFLRSLRVRITLILFVIGLYPCFIVEYCIVNQYEDNAVSVRAVTVKNQCDIICNELVAQNYLSEPTSTIINSQLNMLTNIYAGRILIINSDFRIIKDTYDMDRGKTIISSKVIETFHGQETKYYDKKNGYIEQTIRIQDPDSKESLGVMLVSISADEIHANMVSLSNRGNAVLTICAILVLAFGYILAGYLVRPFHKLTNSIEGITDGLEESISVPDYIETELITNAFNNLLTRLRVVDESRQEFVSNVSHELKTPMASMKVLADSLNSEQNIPVELYREFMLDITEEIDRENQIINDLLSLVKMDKKAANLNLSETNINEMLGSIIKRLTPIADKQNVRLILESFHPILAQVDETKLTLAFSNLIENGIKYNQADGGWVRISLNADQKYFYVTVADSGMGIPEDALPHIFERFYRVDKSHSREIGGTGLGLAIARGSIVMHRGAIRVHSKLNEGTTFSVRIPLNYAG